MRSLILALILSLAPGAVLAQVATGPRTTAFNAVTLAATRTSATIVVSGYSEVKIQIRYTYNAASELAWYFEESDDATTWSLVTKNNVAGSVSRLDGTWATGAASANFTIVLEVKGYKNLRMVLSSTGGGASDLVTGYAIPVRGN